MKKTPFLIDEYGEWYYMGSKITRKPMVKLFSSILTKDRDNTFHLRTPVEDVLVEVIDAPYLVTSLDIVNNNNLTYISLTTNVGVQFIVGKNNPIWVEEKDSSEELIPYSLVKRGLIAKVTRPVYYELAGFLDTKNIKNIEHTGIYSGKDFFILDKPTLRNIFI
jgi:hypothetical protein|tara:strand:+ start:116 stop:607 length:492 start_codon:yes stop_codon:yes gene_type:complete